MALAAGTDGRSALIAVLKSSALAPSESFLAPSVYSVQQTDAFPLVSRAAGARVDAMRWARLRPSRVSSRAAAGVVSRFPVTPADCFRCLLAGCPCRLLNQVPDNPCRWHRTFTLVRPQ